MKPLLEILAGVPTVVYGFFAALTVAPVVKSVGESVGLEVASESALAAGLVMGVMIIPFISSLSDDVINAVPQALRDAAFGLGSTKSEAVRQVVLPAALPGIVAAVILAGVPRGRRDNDRSDGGRVGCEFVFQSFGRSHDRHLTDCDDFGWRSRV